MSPHFKIARAIAKTGDHFAGLAESGLFGVVESELGTDVAALMQRPQNDGPDQPEDSEGHAGLRETSKSQNARVGFIQLRFSYRRVEKQF